MKFGKAGLFVGMLLAASQVHSATLDCNLKPGADTGGWITDRYIFDFDEAAGTANAVDGIVQHFNGGPIVARMTDSTAKKLVISWDVQMTNDSGQQTKMQYRAAIFKADNSVIVRAVPGGYSNSFEARGTCK
jgi:hypothetical protein